MADAVEEAVAAYEDLEAGPIDEFAGDDGEGSDSTHSTEPKDHNSVQCEGGGGGLAVMAAGAGMMMKRHGGQRKKDSRGAAYEHQYQASKQDKPLSLLLGEKQVAAAPAVSILAMLGCIRDKPQDALLDRSAIMLTNKRIVFRWVDECCCIFPFCRTEESFSYRDVQFVWAQHGFNYSWLGWGLMWLIIGIIMAAVNTDAVVLAIGIIFIFLGVGMMLWWVVGLFTTGTWLVINFCRPGVRILDWSNTKFSLNASGSVRRFIHLKHEDAHALMYTLLQHPLVYNGRTHGGARSGMI